MIWYWKTLKIDAERFKKLTDTEKERDEDGDLVWNYDSTFPMRHEDGPVPLHINTPLVPATGRLAQLHKVKKDKDFYWTKIQYLILLLSLRAVSLRSSHFILLS